MDESERKRITDENADHVREWFAASDFDSKKLDTGSGKKGKKADWRFTKRDLTVLCEVKTIFSGGQSGLTEAQYERRRLEAKRKFDSFRKQAVADGSTLLTHKDEQDYLEGRTPYIKQNIRKEEEFNNFLSDIQKQLETDQTINQLPFSISISINAMHIVYGEDRKYFVEWLKGFVLWANKQPEHTNSNSHYTFEPSRRLENRKFQPSIEAFVEMWGPLSYPKLQVGFTKGGVPYNEVRIAEEIAEAVSQLRASIGEATTATIVPMIALWSESDYIQFQSLLVMDATEMQLGNVPKRYDLIDWAFEEYHDLAAIALFVFYYEGDMWNPSLNDKSFPAAYIITNPNLPDAEKVLKAAHIDDCEFITGIASDPLTNKD